MPEGRIARLATSPVISSVVIAFLLGAVIIAITGKDPLFAYQEMLTGAVTGSGLRNTLGRAIPIVGMALALAITFRAGVINLGGEGQMVVGGLAGTLTAIYFPGPGVLVVPLSILTGMAAGAAWAMLPTFGQLRLRLPILITSLLLNYPARALTGYLVRFVFEDPLVTSASTVQVPEAHRMPKLPIFGGVSISLFVLVGVVAAVSYFNRRAVSGYEIGITGLNPRFARYGGVKVDRQTFRVMLVSGAVAGAIGTHLIISDTLRFLDGDLVVAGFAWTGLLVTLLAINRPWPILAAGAFFAALQSGGLAMQRTAEVPWQLAQVLQAVVIVALAARFVLRRRRDTEQAIPGETPLAELEAASVGEV
jgi:simple sugar transport system permease protein